MLESDIPSHYIYFALAPFFPHMQWARFFPAHWPALAEFADECLLSSNESSFCFCLAKIEIGAGGFCVLLPEKTFVIADAIEDTSQQVIRVGKRNHCDSDRAKIAREIITRAYYNLCGINNGTVLLIFFYKRALIRRQCSADLTIQLDLGCNDLLFKDRRK